jgi:hypothetical protein
VVFKHFSGRGLAAIAVWVVAAIASPLTAKPNSDGQTDDRVEAGPKEPSGRIYRYINAQGRESFTNIVENVPSEQRPSGNPSEQFARSESGAPAPSVAVPPKEKRSCPTADSASRSDTPTGWLNWLWKEHQPFAIIGAIAWLLVALTPIMLRHVSAPQWAHTLTRSMQILAFLSVML